MIRKPLPELVESVLEVFKYVFSSSDFENLEYGKTILTIKSDVLLEISFWMNISLISSMEILFL